MSKQDLHGSVNLEYYRVFCSVCECGGITAAAEALCISQPAVSQAVRQLETALGCRLFFADIARREADERGRIASVVCQTGN